MDIKATMVQIPIITTDTKAPQYEVTLNATGNQAECEALWEFFKKRLAIKALEV